jgi:hypothetical protein
VAAFAFGLAGGALAQTGVADSSATATTSTTGSAPAAIGPVTPLDNPSMAFEKLANGRAFLSEADVRSLPGFGEAFAGADGDRDARLDRTEFVDAWARYVDQGAGASDTAPTAAATTAAG